MRDKFKDLIEKILLFLSIGLMIAIFLDPTFFRTLGEIAHTYVLWPVSYLPVEYAILIVAAITGFLSTLSQKYGMNTEQQKEKQARMKEITNELKEAKMSGNEEKVEELKEERAKMTQEMMGNLTQQFKPMAYILLATIPMFAWIRFITDPTSQVYQATGLIIPLLGEVKFDARILIIPGWIVWYFICSIPMSQISRKALDVGI
ncbi:MAG: OxaA/SpoJ/YidC translocase/secretase [Candidatus Methanohalarchaeum thermophilum]|uniref:OxaA/SpoJ/YidC translocase/secretase n=1 Tax=Methanohalarchaeum thermophilum TaxID=1903181 RepID=A0A1Q6DX28_METT1|nr:MAG: OxaA/SpoJ/YidC translocase/secretase [Candidatus Methanohalarchaeum thermophilum]